MMSQPATSKLGKYEHIWKSPGLSQHLKLEQTSLQKGKGDNLKLLNIQNYRQVYFSRTNEEESDKMKV